MPYNVLIVDDSRSMREVIKKVLRLSGFQIGDCLEAGNGEEALSVLANHWVDVILSDIHMPVMDGFGLLQALTAQEDLRDVPVVLITTESSHSRLKEALALGARGYLRKPFRPEEVRALLAQIMGETDGSQAGNVDQGCDF
ncbi:MAG TPA: response regulator [Syntrophobacteraceae bacterium]|nr:response regulator [Syntrophobacteraceae bacterium]